jgi:ribonuclease D
MEGNIHAGTKIGPIEGAAELARAASSFAHAERIALDAEGDGLYRYRARLCTVQLASESAPCVIDALAIADLSSLSGLLGASGPLKIVHDASFDARMLAQRGIALDRVFDTAVAARFLGESATGLATMLSKYLGISLDKTEQQADWGARPLADHQLAYLIADVEHVLPLAEILRARSIESDLLDEVMEESRYVVARALDPEPAREPWTRIKGGRELDPSAAALLWALCDVREREAEQRDVPPFRIAPNAAILEGAKRGRDAASLRKIRGLRDLSDDLLAEAIELAARRGPPRDDRASAPPAEERARVKSRERILSAWRTRTAKERGVNEQAVLPGHCLRDIAALDSSREEAIADVEGFGAKRAHRYVSEIARALQARS